MDRVGSADESSTDDGFEPNPRTVKPDPSTAREEAQKWAYATSWQAERYFVACDELSRIALRHQWSKSTDEALSETDKHAQYWRQVEIVHTEIHFLMIAAGQLDKWVAETNVKHPLTKFELKCHRIVRDSLEHWDEARRGLGKSVSKSAELLPNGKFWPNTWLGRQAAEGGSLLYGVVDLPKLIDAARQLEAELRPKGWPDVDWVPSGVGWPDPLDI